MNNQPDNESPEVDSSTPQPPATPAAAPQPTVTSSTGLAPNVAAGLCAVFPLLGGIVFTILEKSDAFVRFWAMQSIYFGVAALVAGIVVSVCVTVLAFIPILGWLIGILLWLAVIPPLLVLWIISIIKAFQGKRWKMPVLGNMVEKQSSTPPTA